MPKLKSQFGCARDVVDVESGVIAQASKRQVYAHNYSQQCTLSRGESCAMMRFERVLEGTSAAKGGFVVGRRLVGFDASRNVRGFYLRSYPYLPPKSPEHQNTSVKRPASVAALVSALVAIAAPAPVLASAPVRTVPAAPAPVRTAVVAPVTYIAAPATPSSKPMKLTGGGGANPVFSRLCLTASLPSTANPAQSRLCLTAPVPSTGNPTQSSSPSSPTNPSNPTNSKTHNHVLRGFAIIDRWAANPRVAITIPCDSPVLFRRRLSCFLRNGTKELHGLQADHRPESELKQ
jgi:hypothetical protein